MGPLGDFHNFNVFRNHAYRQSVSLPPIEGRTPPELAVPTTHRGSLIWPEEQIPRLSPEGIEQVVFAYSDVSHQYVMHKPVPPGVGGGFPPHGSGHDHAESAKTWWCSDAARTKANH